MNEFTSKLSSKSPYAFRSKRINSQNQKQLESLVDFQNNQSQDYPQPKSKPSRTQNRIPPLNPTRGSFIKKNIRKDDKRFRYMSTQKNQSFTSNNYRESKEGTQSRISETLIQPQKPHFKNKFTATDNESEQISNIQHHISRNQTETMLIANEQKQILIGFDTSLFTQAHKVLQDLQEQIFKGNTSNLIRKYLEIIATGALDDYSNVHFNLHKRKVIKTSILYERISVLLVAFSEVTGNLSAHQNFLSNVLKYVMDNRIITLGLLQNRLEKMQGEKTFISTQLITNNKQSRSFQTIRDNNQIILQIIYKLSTEDNYFFQNLRKFIKGGTTFTIQQCFYFILEYFAFFLHLSGLQDKIPFLAVAPNPYLPPVEKYTLVFDFMQVLYNPKQSSFRPHSQLFIEQMSQLYQLVSFSAVYPKQLQQIIKYVDRKNKITHKLYKHHMVKYKSRLQKDLSRLGRPLSMVVLLDIQQSQLNPNNTFKIKKWNGGTKDNALASITQFLASIPAKRLNAELAITSYKQQQSIKKRMKDKVMNYGIKQL